MFTLLNDLKLQTNKCRKITERKETFNNAEMLYNSMNNVTDAFEDGIFPFKDEFQKKEPDVADETLPY